MQQEQSAVWLFFPLRSFENCSPGPLICDVQSIALHHSIYNILFSLVPHLQLSSVTCQRISRHLDVPDPPLSHSFTFMPGPAAHGSNLLLQHHLVTTAVIQEVFSQMNERKKKHSPHSPISAFFLPPCNTTLVLWVVSKSCVLPRRWWSEDYPTHNQHENSDAFMLHASLLLQLPRTLLSFNALGWTPP